jgi:predicted glycosyl hydrolase (DUF1957 family)
MEPPPQSASAAEAAKREKKLESQRVRKNTLYNTDAEFRERHKAMCKEYGAKMRAAARDERDKKIAAGELPPLKKRGRPRAADNLIFPPASVDSGK